MKAYFEKEWKLCALFVLVTLPLAFLAPYKSYVIQWLIDAESASEIPRLLGVGGLIFLSVFLLEWLGRNIFARINTSIARAMREDLIEGTLCYDLGEFKQNTVGSYVSQITNDITAIQNAFFDGTGTSISLKQSANVSATVRTRSNLYTIRYKSKAKELLGNRW